MKVKSKITFNQQYLGGNVVKIGRMLGAFRKEMRVL